MIFSQSGFGLTGNCGCLISTAGLAAKSAAGTSATSAARRNFTRDLLTIRNASRRACPCGLHARLEYPKCAFSPRRCSMAAQFAEAGVSFQYPENWRLEREEIDSGWLVTVQSPATSFIMVGRRDDCPTPADLADEALSDLRESYPELEAEPGSTRLAGRTTMGHDVRFFLFDLTNTCWIRTFRTTDATMLVMWQVNDLEMETNEPVLRAICTSLTVRD